MGVDDSLDHFEGDRLVLSGSRCCGTWWRVTVWASMTAWSWSRTYGLVVGGSFDAWASTRTTLWGVELKSGVGVVARGDGVPLVW